MHVEIKKIGVKTAFKSVIYLSSIPLLLMILVGIGSAIFGLVTNNQQTLFFGLAYTLMPILMMFFYGLLGMLIAFFYNFFSKRFGGLELTLQEKSVKE